MYVCYTWTWRLTWNNLFTLNGETLHLTCFDRSTDLQSRITHTNVSHICAGPITSLSLGSDTVMEFRNGEDHRPLLLPRRSLLVISGEARCV